MLRTKRESRSVRLITPVVLCLCYSLMMYLFLPLSYAAKRRQQPYLLVDAYQTPSIVYKVVDKEPSVFFKRPSGGIASIALWDGRLFFCSANDKRIYERIGQRERVVFEHDEYIRDIAVDSRGNLYFSVAYASKGDGRIYKLDPSVNEPKSKDFSISKEDRPIWINLKNVDGYWEGYFAFDDRGNLYLGSGSRNPAFIYRLSIEKGSYGSPRKLYRDMEGAIKGIAISSNDPDFIYYADWKQTIYKLNLRYLRRSVEFSRNIASSRSPHLSDITFDAKITKR